MIKGFFLQSTFEYFSSIFLLLAIGFWCKWAFSYGENNAPSFVLKFWDGYSIDVKHVVVMKALDTALWFTVQLVNQYRHNHHVLWRKVKRVWKHQIDE